MYNFARSRYFNNTDFYVHNLFPKNVMFLIAYHLNLVAIVN